MKLKFLTNKLYLYEQVLLTFEFKSTEKKTETREKKEIKKKNKIKQKIKLPNVIRIVCHPRKNVFVIRLLHYRIPSLNKTQKKHKHRLVRLVWILTLELRLFASWPVDKVLVLYQNTFDETCIHKFGSKNPEKIRKNT